MTSIVQQSIGLVAAVLGAPLLALMAVAIKLESPGPVFFRARRVGGGGREFICYKLRTMRWDPQPTGPAVTLATDDRVTRLGAWLRRHRLDELPQLWNVAQGSMLLVGPRPEDPRFVDLGDPLHRVVFMAKPGITGLTQLAFADEGAMIDSDDPERHYREVILPRKLAVDADYLRRRSLRLDLWILGQTILTALGRQTPIDAIEARR
jgi:lipopolysaccharide/colanic/teichoic acid biosynthesis glycosyltransferase